MTKATATTEKDAPKTGETATTATAGTAGAGDQLAAASTATTEKAAKAEKAAPGVKLNESVVEITRNEVTKVPATVYEHEIPILHALHGEDRVRLIETYEVEVSGFSVRDEFKRLQRRYNNKQTGDVVVKAYPMGEAQLADDLGLSLERQTKAASKAASANEGSAKRTKR